MSPSLPVRDQPDPGFRRIRLERRSVPGRTYLLSVATLYRRPVFTAQWPWRDSAVLAWVLMPDQWQGLVTLGERDSLSTLVGRFKSLTSRAVEDRHRVNGWLWGRGFTDRVLGPDEPAMDAARHLVGFPLRSGLVRRLGDYAYWNTAWLDLAGP